MRGCRTSGTSELHNIRLNLDIEMTDKDTKKYLGSLTRIFRDLHAEEEDFENRPHVPTKTTLRAPMIGPHGDEPYEEE